MIASINDTSKDRMWQLMAEAILTDQSCIFVPESELRWMLQHLEFSDVVGTPPQKRMMFFEGFEVLVLRVQ